MLRFFFSSSFRPKKRVSRTEYATARRLAKVRIFVFVSITERGRRARSRAFIYNAAEIGLKRARSGFFFFFFFFFSLAGSPNKGTPNSNKQGSGLGFGFTGSVGACCDGWRFASGCSRGSRCAIAGRLKSRRGRDFDERRREKTSRKVFIRFEATRGLSTVWNGYKHIFTLRNFVIWTVAKNEEKKNNKKKTTDMPGVQSQALQGQTKCSTFPSFLSCKCCALNSRD